MPDKLTDKATKFLTEVLQDGPLPASEIQQMAEEFEIPCNTLTRVKAELKVTSTKEKSESGRWFWELPAELIKPPAPEPPKPQWMTQSNCVGCDSVIPLEQTRYDQDGTVVYGYCDRCQAKRKAEHRKYLGKQLWSLVQERGLVAIDPKDPRLPHLDKAIEHLRQQGIEEVEPNS